MSYVDEQQFKVLCREVAAPRADEIWAEATAGLLLPFGLHHVSPEDGDFREFGDVRVGDIAALELDSALVLACTALAALEQCDGDPVAVFSADFDARSHVLSQYYECGNRLSSASRFSASPFREESATARPARSASRRLSLPC
ncbi:hypothetical protein JL720_12904 [Aureococcus anophagefferens]|nr:hypothetical protein JL720_12904 [Aureococcus anophagefferens]